MTNIADILIKLCDMHGPAGFEEAVTAYAKELIEPYMDETYIDVMGNVIGVKKSMKKGAKKLLLDAHIDEIGLVVTAVEDGFLKFSKLGGLDARTLPASHIKIMTDPPILGVICALPPHVLKDEDIKKALKIEDMFIDVGLSQEDAERKIPIGTPGVLGVSTKKFGENQLCGKALDDRVGFAAILWALELLKGKKLDVDLYVMASVQEEVGMRGAGPGAFAIKPDYAVIVDVNFAKSPDTKPHKATDILGGGVSIARGPNMNVRLTQLAIDCANKKDIKYQISVEPGGNIGLNSSVIQISCGGVATAVFGIPLKYMHTTCEIVSLDDIKCTAELLCETAKSISSLTK